MYEDHYGDDHIEQFEKAASKAKKLASKKSKHHLEEEEHEAPSESDDDVKPIKQSKKHHKDKKAIKALKQKASKDDVFQEHTVELDGAPIEEDVLKASQKSKKHASKAHTGRMSADDTDRKLDEDSGSKSLTQAKKHNYGLSLKKDNNDSKKQQTKDKASQAIKKEF